ncbi:MAG: adenylate/guanylate cyclase domain-containing protein [Marinomonas sp.]
MASGLFQRGWRNVREAGTQRLVVTLVLLFAALLVAGLSWKLPILREAEQGLYDFRSYHLAEYADQDERMMLVVYDEDTLIEARKRSPLDRGLLIDALKNIDGLGAKAIGIDILLDQPQDEDGELIETLRAMKTPVALAYVDVEGNEEDITYRQQEYLEAFQAELEGSNVVPASIQLSNAYGVTRVFPEIDDSKPALISRAMLTAAGEGDKALAGYEGSINFRLCANCANEGDEEEVSEESAQLADAPLYTKLAIGLYADPDVAAAVNSEYPLKDRYVLIGADLVDVDRVPTTLTSEAGRSAAGVSVHADKIAQMLDGKRLAQIAPWQIWALTALMMVMAVLTGLLEFVGNWRIYPILAVQAVVVLGLPFYMKYAGIDTYGLPAAGWIAGWVIAFASVTSAARASGAVQRNFAQGALGKYLPREMAQEIIDKPDLLSLHGEKKEIYVMFSDLEGFTKMSHAISPEMVAKLLNRYLEMLSNVVLEHGGVIDKFVGDAVVAFWGAPIAKADDADRAARAGYAIWEAGEAFRAEVAAMDPDLPKIGKTRVGMHFGEAVVGNFGGESRIQYTALGDSMNTAARLEAANKALETSVMASREFAERTTLNWWRPMGKVVLRGRARPVELMEPAPKFSEKDQAELSEAMALVSTRRNAAIEAVEGLIERNLADKGLPNLLNRMNNLNEEDAYVLG